ncbi:MAG: hypothetical protein EXS48_02795 [Candidatus Staskawiczbacteria bacterium]|nr:hypothetical protein [Candidatus Staskawiczbacteria bacterium]
MKKYFLKGVILSGAVVILTFSASFASALTISSISPASATAGSSDFTLTVNGSGFIMGSFVKFNGLKRTTAFISSGQLKATIPASDLTKTGDYPIAVTNANRNLEDTVSNKLIFTVNSDGGYSGGGGSGSGSARGTDSSDVGVCKNDTLKQDIKVISCGCSNGYNSIVTFDFDGNATCKSKDGIAHPAICKTTKYPYSSANQCTLGGSAAPTITKATLYYVRGDGSFYPYNYKGDFLDIWGKNFSKDSKLYINDTLVDPANYRYSPKECKQYRVKPYFSYYNTDWVNVDLPVDIQYKIPNAPFYMFGNAYTGDSYSGSWNIFRNQYNQLSCDEYGEAIEMDGSIPSGKLDIRVSNADLSSSNTVTAGGTIVAGCPHIVPSNGRGIYDVRTPNAILYLLQDGEPNSKDEISITGYTESAGDPSVMRGYWIKINGEWKWVDSGPGFVSTLENSKYAVSFKVIPRGVLSNGVNISVDIKAGYDVSGNSSYGATGMLAPKKNSGNMAVLSLNDMDDLAATFDAALLKYGISVASGLPFPNPPLKPGSPDPTCSTDPSAKKKGGCYLNGKIGNPTLFDPFADVSGPRAYAVVEGSPSIVPVFIENLQPWTTSDAVKSLQEFLISAGYPIPAGATGYNGKQTSGAVCKFQVDKGLLKPILANGHPNPLCGNIGPLTIAKLNEVSGVSPTSSILTQATGLATVPTPITPIADSFTNTPTTTPIVTDPKSTIISVPVQSPTPTPTPTSTPAPMPAPTPTITPDPITLKSLEMMLKQAASIVDAITNLIQQLKK